MDAATTARRAARDARDREEAPMLAIFAQMVRVMEDAETVATFEEISRRLSVGELGGVIQLHCPDSHYGTETSDRVFEPPNMPTDIYGNDAQKDLIQDIRQATVNHSEDFVYATDEKVTAYRRSHPTSEPLTFLLIVRLYEIWSIGWKTEHADRNPSRASSSASSRASSHTPSSRSPPPDIFPTHQDTPTRTPPHQLFSPGHSPAPFRPSPGRYGFSSVRPDDHPTARRHEDSRSRSPAGSGRGYGQTRPHTAPHSSHPRHVSDSRHSELPSLLQKMKMTCISET